MAPSWHPGGTPSQSASDTRYGSGSNEYSVKSKAGILPAVIIYTSFIVIETDVNVARRDGAEVAGWTLDRKIRVRFPAYPHRMWAPDGKEVKDVFGRPGAHVEVGSAR